MPISRLGVVNPAANTDSVIATFTEAHLASVTVANKSILATPVCKVTIWIVPSNATIEAQYIYIASQIIVGVGQSFETFRFALNAGDTLYVRSSTANASFSCNGIMQDDEVQPEGLPQTFTNKVIRGENNTVYLDRGTTAQRSASAEEGYVRYNTETHALEVKTNTGWRTLGWDA